MTFEQLLSMYSDFISSGGVRHTKLARAIVEYARSTNQSARAVRESLESALAF